MTQRRHAVLLAAILVLAAALRLRDIGTGWFGVDQARDLTIAADIAAGRGWPLAGPPMRNQIRLGGLYYGFWVPPFVFGGGACAAYLWAGLLGTVAVALAERLGRRAGGPGCGLAAALLLATSPIAVIDERVAWPPALMPLCTGMILLLAIDQLERPHPIRAVLLGAVCGLATQVHLSLVPLAALGLGSLLFPRHARSGRHLGLAAVAFLLPLVPMALVAGEPLAGASPVRVALPPLGNRIAAVLVAPWRAVGAVTGDAPAPIALLLGLEALWLPLALGCALVLAWRRRLGLWRRLSRWSPESSTLVETSREQRVLGLVVLALLGSVAAVVLLPAEAWAYYLDPALLPASVVLGWALTRWHSPAVPWVLVGFGLARVIVLCWWIGDTAQRGFISADFEQLALTSAEFGEGGRVRLLTLATRQEVWPRLLARAGGDPARLHGPGFADLATDNAYFEKRALVDAELPASGPESEIRRIGQDGRGGTGHRAEGTGFSTRRPATERDVALVYPEGLDPGFLGGADIETLGPFVAVALPVRLRPERGRIIACDGRPVSLPWPRVPASDPRHYGRGEIRRSHWPCARVRVEVPIEGSGSWRLLAAVRGAGRIVAGRASAVGQGGHAHHPSLELPGPIPPGFDLGWAVPATAVALQFEIDVAGPATVDLVALPALPEPARVDAAAVAGG